MKKAIIVFVIIGIAGTVACNRTPQTSHSNSNHTANANTSQAVQPGRVPAHFTDAASARPLKPTLDPEQFTGKIRRAYTIAREIPETLAQLPCYCYCDQGFGHKSLHSCYEDDHSAHCATCVDEAILADRLQKANFTPAQIREQIIQRYAF
jgi:hypothetical protein